MRPNEAVSTSSTNEGDASCRDSKSSSNQHQHKRPAVSEQPLALTRERSDTAPTMGTETAHALEDHEGLCSMFGSDEYPLEKLPQEVEEGNIEYKLKLVNPTPLRLDHLISQLKWRLQEGQGEAIYEVGVEDSGVPSGISVEDMEASLMTLGKMAQALKADMTVLRERDGDCGRVAEVLIRKFSDENQFFELRVATVGNVDAGKSTLLGVLTRGGLDNGRGKARTNLFRHKHEIETGRTSSVGHEIIGFDSKGEITNYSNVKAKTWTEICENASKVMTFIDLAGHAKYLKTTVSGLTGMAPDFVMVIVGANMGISGMTKEHIGVALALKLPLFVVVTKIDMCPENVLDETMKNLTKMLKSPGCRKMPMLVKSIDDVLLAAQNFTSDRLAPIFQVSNVTGDGLDLLKKFLNVIPSQKSWTDALEDHFEMYIDDNFSVTGVGTVVSGTILGGSITMGQTMLLGPNEFGKFEPVQVKSIHRKRLPVRMAKAGEAPALALKKIRRSQIRRGMALVDPAANPKATWEFEAEVLVLFHSTTIAVRYQSVVHCGTIRQAAHIVDLDDKALLRTGDKAKVRFRFICRPEYIKPGARLIFREGKTKGIGKVSAIFPDAATTRLPLTEKMRKLTL